MTYERYSRRKFINSSFRAGSIFLGGALFFMGCESKKSPPEPENKKDAPSEGGDKKDATVKNACDDLSGVSKGELEKRQKFAYVDKSQVPGNNCGNCGLFVPQKDNQDCGKCLLFQGPVHAAGHCIQYVAKVQ